MITFVTYFVSLSDENRQTVQKVNPNLRLYDPNRILEIQYASIMKTHPNAHHVVITDHHTKLSLPKKINVVRAKLDPATIAYSKLDALCRFIKKAPSKSHYVFLDPDVLLQKNCEPLFDNPVDILLLTRRWRFPIQSNVLLIKKGAGEKCLKFLKSALDTMKQLPNKKKSMIWTGDEYCMSKFFGIKRFLSFKGKVAESEGTKFLFLQAKHHCFEALFPGDKLRRFPNTEFLHFGFTSLEKMEEYWEAFNK